MKLLTTTFLVAISIFSGCALADDKSAVAIDAIRVARDVFRSELERKPNDWKYASYANNIDNYSIGVSDSDDTFVVVFVIKQRDVKFNGGRVDYYLRKKDLSISRVVRHK